MSRKNRYSEIVTDDEFYESLLDRRDLKKIIHERTPIMRQITPAQRRTLTRTKHIWKTGDTLMKLAHKHYGNVELWWVIAWYNTRPTEAHYKLGDVVYIPHPVSRVMSYLRRE